MSEPSEHQFDIADMYGEIRDANPGRSTFWWEAETALRISEEYDHMPTCTILGVQTAVAAVAAWSVAPNQSEGASK